MRKGYKSAAVLIKADATGKCHQALLTDVEQDAVMAYIAYLHGGAVKVMEEPTESIDIVRSTESEAQ